MSDASANNDIRSTREMRQIAAQHLLNLPSSRSYYKAFINGQWLPFGINGRSSRASTIIDDIRYKLWKCRALTLGDTTVARDPYTQMKAFVRDCVNTGVVNIVKFDKNHNMLHYILIDVDTNGRETYIPSNVTTKQSTG